MSNRHSAGFTLIEMIVAIVILSVGLAGVLSAFNMVVQSSSDPLVHKQMLALAEEMMEEVMLKPFAAGPGTISGCTRTSADDIADYAGYSQPVCTIDGTPIAALSGYNVAVTLTASAVGAVPAASAQQVTVTVTHGGDSISLTGWRIDYAGGLS